MATLSQDLITEILLRLPAKPLLRFKSVCKAWYGLITDPNFATVHQQRSLATETNIHFVIRMPGLYLADFDTFQNPVELNYPYKNIEDRSAEVVGSCHGLLCIWNMDQELSLYLYNPTTQTHKSLPYLPVNRALFCGPLNFSFGFGYDGVSGGYKCVRVLQIPYKDTNYFDCEVMVYSSKTDCWTEGPHPPYYFEYCRLFSALLHETIHWAAESKDRTHLPIVSFSLRNETFSSIPLPDTDTESARSIFIGVLDECLCVSVNYWDHYDVWVMKEYGVVGSWVRQCTVQNGGRCNVMELERPVCLSASRKELFFRQLCSLVVSISMETSVMTEVLVAGFNRCWDAHACVENLLMLPERSH